MHARHLVAALIGLAPAVALATACGESGSLRPRDTGGTSDTRPAPADTASPGDTASADTRPLPLDTAGGDTAGGGCDRQGWNPTGSTVAQISAGVEAGTYDTLFVDSYSDDVAVPYDLLGLELYFDFGADPGPHVFTFTGESYADCAECLLVYAGCDDDFVCERVFLASSGTLNVTENGGNGGRFIGTVSDVVLAEVTIDADTFASTPVPGGQRWCIPSFTYQTFIDLYRPGE